MFIRFHPDAEQELREAIMWYEHQRKGLSAEFLLCIDEAINRLKSNPLLYPLIHKKIHRVVVRRFPFAVFYEVLEFEVRVLAVFHSRRDPAYWKSRT